MVTTGSQVVPGAPGDRPCERRLDRPAGAVPAVPECRLHHQGERLVITLRGPGLRRRVVLKHATPAVVGRTVAAHRRALRYGLAPLGGRPWPQPGPGWAPEELLAVSATEIHLHRVHALIGACLVELLAPLARVALRLEGELLWRLPVETAHRPGWPALFEVTQCYRAPRRRVAPARPLPRRRFRLTQLPGVDLGLDAVPLERALVAGAHQAAGSSPPGGGARPERLVHVAGHDPLRSAWEVPAAGAAHLVLSGCDSLPAVLPAGVASVVGSLWPVDDHQSASLMAAYHHRLALGIGPLEALRQAQLLHRPLPPDAWAAYVYLGQPD